MSTLMPGEPEPTAASPIPGSDVARTAATGTGSSPLTFIPPTAGIMGADPVDVGLTGAGAPGDGRPAAHRRKSYTVHIGPAGRITLASRDNAAAGAQRPATLRVGARGSVVMISAAGLRQPPPIPPE